MSYMALYRKFRPAQFDDVKGQEHIVTTLKNQIKAERIGHAYLFCGTRGTGKTTIAKIFAKAVNCEHPVDGSPCGECKMCRAIQAGISMNVIEIDAASNNGVDNIREIKEEVAYSPTEGQYKVYIIDEVHMLSAGAFNALLKTLEEPPSYVIFILATTEMHKIPVTILSRCQKYNFKRITIDTITDRLAELMEKEKVEVEDKALRYIAKAADGSMRDALSLLDQCIAFYLGQTLTYDKVLDVLGAVDMDIFYRLLDAVYKADALSAIRQLEELIVSGKELSQFVTDFIWYMRNLMLIQSADQMEDILDVSTENLQPLKEQAAQISQEVLIRYIRIFSDLANRIKYADQKRILVEITMIQLCRPQMDEQQTIGSLEQRILGLEQQLENGVMVTQVKEVHETAPASQPEVKKELPPAVPDDIKEVIRNWNGIINGCSGRMKAQLKYAVTSLGEKGQLLIVMEDRLWDDYYKREEPKELLETLIMNKIGRKVTVEFRHEESGQPVNELYPDLSKINMEIVEED